MMSVFFTVIIALFQSTVGYVLKILVDKFFKGKKRLPDKNKYLLVISQITEILNSLTSYTNASRAMLLKCHNGGGIPKLGSEIYSTVVLESFTDGRPERASWEKQRLDNIYIGIMVNLNAQLDGVLTVSKDDFKGSVLEAIYEKNAVGISHLATIYSNEKGWYYLSINFPEDLTELSTNDQATIQGLINQLRNLLAKNKDIL